MDEKVEKVDSIQKVKESAEKLRLPVPVVPNRDLITEEVAKEIAFLLAVGNPEFLEFINRFYPSCFDCVYRKEGFTHTFGRGYSMYCPKTGYVGYTDSPCKEFQSRHVKERKDLDGYRMF